MQLRINIENEAMKLKHINLLATIHYRCILSYTDMSYRFEYHVNICA